MSALFASALTNASAPLQHLTTWNGSDPSQRFAIYRNNVAVSLRTALETTFPVTRKLVGDAFFAGMARAYCERELPRSPVMARYGDSFADFIKTFEPAEALGYLSDIARLEFLRVEAFHAGDVAFLGAEAFATLEPETLPAMRVMLHLSARVLRSRYPIVSIWAAHHGEAAFDAIDLSAPEDALIVRPALNVTVHPLDAGIAAALLALSQGATIADAVTAGADDSPAFSPTALFATLIKTGVVTAIATGEMS